MNNQLQTSFTANLIVIIDDRDEDATAYTYILTLFSRKMKKLDIFLRKIFFITKNDYDDVKRQVGLIYAELNTTSYLFITTTRSDNDNLLDMTRLLSHQQNGKLISSSNVFLLKYGSFHDDLLQLVNHLLLNRQRFKLLFKSEDCLKKFLGNYANNEISFKQIATNYACSCLDVAVNNLNIYETHPDLAEVIRSNSACLTMLGNAVNADSFLYEFDRIELNEEKREDIKFLLTKIDLNSFKLKLKASIEWIETALKRYDTNQLCISFNGGKDCCVVFYLFYAVCLRMGARFPLKVLLIQIRNQFAEMDSFVQHVIKSFYGANALEFILFDENNSESKQTLKDCLNKMKTTHPIIKGILMGTRRTDSAYFKNMNVFAPTDGDWPKYMRVNPILDWTYSEIWFFIRVLNLPYCSLYDRGYTSIDSQLNTVPNQDLLKENGEYLAAYWLEDQDAERKSRKKL